MGIEKMNYLLVKLIFTRISTFRNDALLIAELLSDRKCSVAEAGLLDGQISAWVDAGLVASSLSESEKITRAELAWLRFIKAADEGGVPRKHLLIFLSKPKMLGRFLSYLRSSSSLQALLKAVLPAADRDLVQHLLDESLRDNSERVSFPFNLNLLSAFACFAAVNRQMLTVLFDKKGNCSIFSPYLLSISNHDADELLRLLAQGHIGIPVHGLLDVDIEKAPTLTALIETEQSLMDIIRSDQNICNITIRFSKEGRMSMLEYTREKLLEEYEDIKRIIHGAGYHDLVIKAADGRVLSFQNTTKIKFN